MSSAEFWLTKDTDDLGCQESILDLWPIEHKPEIDQDGCWVSYGVLPLTICEDSFFDAFKEAVSPDAPLRVKLTLEVIPDEA